MHKQKVTKLGLKKMFCPKLTKMESIISQRINYNGVAWGSKRPVAHTQQKLTQVPTLGSFL